MMVKTPFFIYPAYCEPRMTIFPSSKLREMAASLTTPGICLLAVNSPALKM